MSFYTESMSVDAEAHGDKGGHTKQRAKRKKPTKTRSNKKRSSSAKGNTNNQKSKSNAGTNDVGGLPNMNVFDNSSMPHPAQASAPAPASAPVPAGIPKPKCMKSAVKCAVIPVDMVARMTGSLVFERGTISDQEELTLGLFQDKERRLNVERFLTFIAKVSAGREFPDIVDSACQDYVLEDLQLFAISTSFTRNPRNYYRFIVYNTPSKNKKKLVNVDVKYPDGEFKTVQSAFTSASSASSALHLHFICIICIASALNLHFICIASEL